MLLIVLGGLIHQPSSFFYLFGIIPVTIFLAIRNPFTKITETDTGILEKGIFGEKFIPLTEDTSIRIVRRGKYSSRFIRKSEVGIGPAHIYVMKRWYDLPPTVFEASEFICFDYRVEVWEALKATKRVHDT